MAKLLQPLIFLKAAIKSKLHLDGSNATRAAVQAENPGIAFGEVGKELGRRWGLLSDDEKAAFKSPAV